MAAPTEVVFSEAQLAEGLARAEGFGRLTARLRGAGMTEEAATTFGRRLVRVLAQRFGTEYVAKMTGHLEEIFRLRTLVESRYNELLGKLEADPNLKLENLPSHLRPDEFNSLFGRLENELDAIAQRTPAKDVADFAKKGIDAKELVKEAREAEPKKPAEPAAAPPPARLRALELLKRLAGKNRAARQAVDTLEAENHTNLLDELAEEFEAERDPRTAKLARQALTRLGKLTKNQRAGLDHIAGLERAEKLPMGLTNRSWFDILELPANFRNDLLDLVADLKDVVEEGMAEAIRRGLREGQYDPQGALGHLYAARTLKAVFGPSVRMRFEVEYVGREVDIEVRIGGRRIDVEVKTSLGSEPTIKPKQIRSDLLAHVRDGWQDMLYRYAPEQQGNLEAVKRAMLRALLDPADTEMQQALARQKLTPADAAKLLNDQFDQGLVDTFSYEAR